MMYINVSKPKKKKKNIKIKVNLVCFVTGFVYFFGFVAFVDVCM